MTIQTHGPKSYTCAGTLSRGRVLLVLLSLLLFACQNYLIQTHIHGLPFLAPLSDGLYAPPPASQLPVDQAVCPTCQAALHAGAYLLPGALAALPPTLAVSLTPQAFAFLLPSQPLSHDWNGRAPPAHR